MTSAVDTSFPANGVAVSKSTFRAQMGVISSEITALQASFRDIKLWYGAVGDGVADDTTALTNAINSGLNIYIPPGTYNCTTSLSMATSKQRIMGAGRGISIIKFTSGSTASGLGTFSGGGPSAVAVKDLTLDMSATTSSSTQAFGFVNVTGLTIENVDILQPYGSVVLTGCNDVLIDGLYLYQPRGTTNPYYHGILIYGQNGGTASRRLFLNNIRVISSVSATRNFVIEGDVQFVYVDGLYVGGAGQAGIWTDEDTAAPSKLFFNNVTVNTVNTDGVYFQYGSDIFLSNFYITGAGDNGIQTGNAAERVRLSNGTVTACGEHGLSINTPGTQIVNVDSLDNNTTNGDFDALAIFGSADGSRIIGGKYGNSEGGSTALTKYGIDIANSTPRIVIVGADMAGNTTAPFRDGNTSSSDLAVVFAEHMIAAPPIAVAGLPAAANNTNQLYFVTDATGGASIAYSNNSNWISLRTGSAV